MLRYRFYYPRSWHYVVISLATCLLPYLSAQAEEQLNSVRTQPPGSGNQPATLTVLAPKTKKTNSAAVTLDAAQIQQSGGSDFGNIMRYQPLVSGVGTQAGSGNGKSGFDRAGYTGYNIRGLEANRVGITIDGVSLPQATGRSYAGRAGVNTFGIGRDYLDPWLYRTVAIKPGASAVGETTTAIGGLVGFHSKSPDDFLYPGKSRYAGLKSDFNSADHDWHQGATLAVGDEIQRALLLVSRRDGQQTRNQSGATRAFPENWHSNALLASGIWQPNDQHKLTTIFNFYDKTSHSRFNNWDISGRQVLGNNYQQSETRRISLSVQDEYIPLNRWFDQMNSQLAWQKSQAHDNTFGPYSSTSYGRTFSDYNTTSLITQVAFTRSQGRHAFRYGMNASIARGQRPFNQTPLPISYLQISPSQADDRTLNAGAFFEDAITYQRADRLLTITPGLRFTWQSVTPEHLDKLATGTSLPEADVRKYYSGSTNAAELLPAVKADYQLTEHVMTYLKYQRGAQFTNASQLYGSWNMGANYAPGRNYALLGNTHLKNETSDNFEWGMHAETTGLTVAGSIFYNRYSHFIAYQRYTRTANPARFSQVPGNLSTIYQAENRDKAYIYGAELRSTAELGYWFNPLNGFSTTLALGYSKGKAKSSLADDRYQDLDSVAPMKAVLVLAYDAAEGEWGVALNTTLVKGKQAQETNRETVTNGSITTDSDSNYIPIAGYGLVDLNAYWQLARNLKLNVGIYNLTNRKYLDYLSSRQLTNTTNQDRNDIDLAIMPGRTAQIGLNLDF